MYIIANSQLFAELEVKTLQKKFLSDTDLTTCEWQIGVNETEKWVLSTGNVLGRETAKAASVLNPTAKAEWVSIQQCGYMRKISLQHRCI